MSYRTERGSAGEAFVTYVFVIALAAYVATKTKGALATIASLVVTVGVGVPALLLAGVLLSAWGKSMARMAQESAERAAQRRLNLEYRERQEQQKRDREAQEIRQAGRQRLKVEALQAAMLRFMEDNPEQHASMLEG